MTDEDEWEPRLVRIPKGAHRSPSRDTPGADRELLRADGTNKLLGPSESIPFDPYDFQIPNEESSSKEENDRELSPETQELVDVLGALLTQVVWELGGKTVQHFRPVVKHKMSALRKRLSRGSSATQAQSESTELASLPAASSEEVQAAVVTPEVDMSLSEYQEGFRRLILTEQYAAQLKDLLSRACITDGSVPPEIESAVKAVLEGNATSLDERSIVMLADFLATEKSTNRLPPMQREATEKLRNQRQTG